MAYRFMGGVDRFIRPNVLAPLVLSLLCLQPVWAGSPAHLRHVTIQQRQGHTVITLSLNRQVPYHYFELGNPPRLVVDMMDTRGRHPDIRQGAGKAIRKISFGEHHGGKLRAVFVLSKKAKAAMRPSSGHGATLTASLPLGGQAPSHDAPAPTSDASIKHAHEVALRTVRQSGPAIVVIDPGHGGEDPGTTGPHGLHEKTVTLAIGKIVAKKLNHTPGVRAYMTRHTDHYVTLTDRVLFAQRRHANVFVSIHENAYNKNPSINGGTCFALSLHGATDAEAEQEARAENSRDRSIDGVDFSKYGHSLGRVLTDLFQTSAMQAESHLGEDIIRQFGKVEPIYDHKVQRANFAVLRDPLIPSVLCETAFLSNPKQARDLHHHYFRAEIADAIYKGIMNYLHDYAPMRIAQNASRKYVVKKGDTLSGIAGKFDVDPGKIKRVNGLQTTMLKVGEHLTIPPTHENS